MLKRILYVRTRVRVKTRKNPANVNSPTLNKPDVGDT